MEASLAHYVLKKYLDLFEQNTYDFKYHFAPNGVIDWYGRTIRGAIRIHDYLRHDVCSVIDHENFLQPQFCDPIESKTSHMRTKIFTNKVIDTVHPINRLPDKVPLKTYADSDAEDNQRCSDLTGALLKKINEPTTPNKSYIEDLTPPASADKEDAIKNLKLHQVIEQRSNSNTEHLKRSYTDSFNSLNCSPISGKRSSMHYGTQSLLDDSSSSDDDDDFNLEALYSPLQYIEANGVLRAKIKPDSDATPYSIRLLRQYSGGRETRLRVSYRRRLSDNDIQFALIIYEFLDPLISTINSKRSLIAQFLAISSDDEQIEEQVAVSNIEESTCTIISTDTITNTQDDIERDDASTMALSIEQMRTPTKLTRSPQTSVKRKTRSAMRSVARHKRLNNSPTGPIPKRSAARSLRL